MEPDSTPAEAVQEGPVFPLENGPLDILVDCIVNSREPYVAFNMHSNV